MDQQTYREIVSGKRKDAGASLLRFLLRLAGIFYSAAVRLRNLLYSTGVLRSRRVNAVIICIGNITTGGTGKTPLVQWACGKLTHMLPQATVAILTRGYKACRQADGGGEPEIDEPALLARSCPEIPVVVNPDRVAGASEAIQRLGAEVIVLDDGFQHRRLRRDLDIVTIDATCPFGYGRLLPAGLLREPVQQLKRAHGLVLTRCDQVGNDELRDIERRLKRLNPEAWIAETEHAPAQVIYVDGKEEEPANLRGKKVFAFCGIGNPDSFLGTIAGAGAEIVGSMVFDDHCSYTQERLDEIIQRAKQCGADVALTTSKDWTKIEKLSLPATDVGPAYLNVEIRFLEGENALRSLIERTITDRIAGD